MCCGNVFTDPLPSNGYTRYNTLKKMGNKDNLLTLYPAKFRVRDDPPEIKARGYVTVVPGHGYHLTQVAVTDKSQIRAMVK
jgi:hypothetical protein